MHFCMEATGIYILLYRGYGDLNTFVWGILGAISVCAGATRLCIGATWSYMHTLV